MTPEIDPVTGQKTTGHEWNGIKELNTPMPKAFHIWLWGSIAVCVVLWLLYPSFPRVSGFFGGVLGYSSREAVQEAVSAGQKDRDVAFAVFDTMDVTELAEDRTLRARFEPEIAVLFRDNCAACHGRMAQGQVGFPDLKDDHWLWSAAPDEIEYTLQVGINSKHPDTRYAEMLAFGRDELLSQGEISDVVDYVYSLTNDGVDQDAVAAGAVVFEENCASCHGDRGEGGYENGAPSLIDKTWIYGGSRAEIDKTVQYGRAGVMPAWDGRLTPSEIRQLTLYVLWQGDDDGDG